MQAYTELWNAMQANAVTLAAELPLDGPAAMVLYPSSAKAAPDLQVLLLPGCHAWRAQTNTASYMSYLCTFEQAESCRVTAENDWSHLESWKLWHFHMLCTKAMEQQLP